MTENNNNQDNQNKDGQAGAGNTPTFTQADIDNKLAKTTLKRNGL